jgi:hydroxymethylglutaryl-CoA lyase
MGTATATPEARDAVTVVEVGPRDGLQNEDRTVPTATKVELIRRLVAAGARAVEVGAFVRPDRVPQMADSDEVIAGLALPPGVRAIALVPNTAGLERALRTGVTEVAVFAAASEAFSRANLGRSVRESLDMFRPVVEGARRAALRVRGYVSTVLGCPYQGPVPLDSVRTVVAALLDMGCDEISLGDTIGVGTPAQVHELLDALDGVLPLPMTAVHMHDTYGMGLANTLAAIEHGVRTVDTSVGGLGGCPFAGPGARGNLATEDLVYALRDSRLTTGLDLDALVAISWWLAEELDHDPPSRVAQALGRQRRRALQAPSTLD